MLNILETLTHHTFFCISPLHKLPLFRELLPTPTKGRIVIIQQENSLPHPMHLRFHIEIVGII